tara:strand:- start:837 stop:1511 length:675 start_codon:yes stop_codon:yes gene_type:complete
MEYAKLNNKIRSILKPVKNSAQIASAIMLLKQSENKSIEKENVRTEKLVEKKANPLYLWMGPYFTWPFAGSLKTSLLNKQGGSNNLQPEDMAIGTVFIGEAILILAHGENENYSLYLSVGAQEVQISIAGTPTGMSAQYRLHFQIHFSHGDADSRKFYFTGFFEDKDSDGKIIQIPITSVMQTIDATSAKEFDIKFKGTSLSTSCKIIALTLFKYTALNPIVPV